MTRAVANGAVVEGSLKCNPPAEAAADAKLKLVNAKPGAKPQPKAEEAPVIIIE